jgi:cobalt/nickel transport protein
MTTRLLGAALGLAGLLGAGPASAHFQLVYTPDSNIAAPGDVPVTLVFWHPFENGHAMDMGPVQTFFAVNRGRRIDLMDRLAPIPFHGPENPSQAYRATVPVTRSGDYVLAVVPSPYYEESEDIYIQQIAKSVLNLRQVPTDWAEPVGLPTEIVPLNKPYNVLAGSTFSGRVLAAGQPVAGAEIEIEYIAAAPAMDGTAAAPPTVEPPPGGAVVAITNAKGEFTFGIPRAGIWGFAALGSGPAKEHEGKELSQDAVLWVQAYDLATPGRR